MSDEVVEETFCADGESGQMPVIVRRTSLASSPTGCSTRCSERPSPSWNGESPLLRMWTKPSNTASACGVRAPMEVMTPAHRLTYSIHQYLFPHIENSTEPSKLLKQKMDQGKLGFKSGEGFMKWSQEEIDRSQKDLIEGLIKVARALDRL